MKITKKELCEEAKQIKTFIETKKALPKYCTIGSNQYSIHTTTYLITRLLEDLHKNEVNVVHIKEPNVKYLGNVEENISKATYSDMIYRFNEYVEKNKRVPSYVISIRNKIDFITFTYGVCKIANYYKENNRLPTTCLFTSRFVDLNKKTSSNTKKNNNTSTSNNTNKQKCYSCNHCLKQGPDCIGQPDKVSCGIQMLWQMCKKFGIKVKKSDLKKWAGTTSAGTSHQGLLTAVAKINKVYKTNLTLSFKNLSDFGKTRTERWSNICKLVQDNNSAIGIHNCYRMKYGHYEGLLQTMVKDNNTKVMNSLGNKCGTGFCGYIETRSIPVWETYISGISQPSICVFKIKR